MPDSNSGCRPLEQFDAMAKARTISGAKLGRDWRTPIARHIDESLTGRQSMLNASLAWLPCAHKQEDGSTHYAVIELNDARMAQPVILQIPEHFYSLAGGNDIVPNILDEVVARINRGFSVEVVQPLPANDL
jgi:hypothetical protein